LKDKISWPIVALAALATLIFVVVLGACIWLVEQKLVSASIIVAPISTFLFGAAAAAVAYMRALMKLPPAPYGTEYRLVPSLSPPPSDAQLLGQIPLPASGRGVAQIKVQDIDIHDDAPVVVDVPASKGNK
jgi:hypothetical protein